MLAALILIVSCYVNVRLAEVIADERKSDARTFLRVIAGVAIAITFFSCGDAMLTAGRSNAP